MMTIRQFRRLSMSFCLVLLLNTFIVQKLNAADTVDQKCLKDAATERTNRLKKAYDDFAKDMKDAADQLRDDEASRLSFGDLAYSQSEIARSYANYSYEVSERSRDLSAKTTDAWNDYQSRRAKCNASAIPGTQSPAYYPPSVPYGSYGGYASYPYPYYYGTNGRNPYGFRPYGYGDDIYRGCSYRPLSPPPPRVRLQLRSR